MKTLYHFAPNLYNISEKNDTTINMIFEQMKIKTSSISFLFIMPNSVKMKTVYPKF